MRNRCLTAESRSAGPPFPLNWENAASGCNPCPTAIKPKRKLGEV